MIDSEDEYGGKLSKQMRKFEITLRAEPQCNCMRGLITAYFQKVRDNSPLVLKAIVLSIRLLLCWSILNGVGYYLSIVSCEGLLWRTYLYPSRDKCDPFLHLIIISNIIDSGAIANRISFLTRLAVLHLKQGCSVAQSNKILQWRPSE